MPYTKEYYTQNKERIQKTNRDWANSHKKRRFELNKNWRERHKNDPEFVKKEKEYHRNYN
jgi:hypothetical protein